jgi:hypothetical protein
MKNLFYLIVSALLFSCSSNTEEDAFLVRVSSDEYEFGDSFFYVNQNGDTIVPAGKYAFSFSDTIYSFGLVMNEAGMILALDVQGKETYEVFNYDNGPDYPSEGVFRIIKNGKIGYADEETGVIVIEPQYNCAFPFEEGKAKVSLNCQEEQMGEYTEWVSDEWIYIDKKGNNVK